MTTHTVLLEKVQMTTSDEGDYDHQVRTSKNEILRTLQAALKKLELDNMRLDVRLNHSAHIRGEAFSPALGTVRVHIDLYPTNVKQFTEHHFPQLEAGNHYIARNNIGVNEFVIRCIELPRVKCTKCKKMKPAESCITLVHADEEKHLCKECQNAL